MPIEILMPALSPTMTEGNLARWLKKEGEAVSSGDVIAEIETDKATMEVEAVDEGVLGRILVAEGSEGVPVNQLIALLLEEGEDSAELDNYAANDAAPVADAPAKADEKPAPATPQVEQPTVANDDGARVFASPLAKCIAKQEGISLSSIAGSGPHGRIVKADVLAAQSSGTSAPAVSLQGGVLRAAEESVRIPHSSMRKVIAKRLVESKQTVPHFYLNVECVLDKLLALRAEMNKSAPGAPDAPAYKLSVNDFIIKAVAKALRDVPDANVSWEDDAMIRYQNVDISVAVAIDGGLITPILRSADQKNLSVLSNEMKDLAKRARENALKPEEFQGGGFSISNLGMFGIKNFNAIINPPQACILAVGQGTQKPIIQEGQVQVATTMEATLSCDHRAVDGAVGAQFLQAFKNYVENPVTMLV